MFNVVLLSKLHSFIHNNLQQQQHQKQHNEIMLWSCLFAFFLHFSYKTILMLPVVVLVVERSQEASDRPTTMSAKSAATHYDEKNSKDTKTTTTNEGSTRKLEKKAKEEAREMSLITFFQFLLSISQHRFIEKGQFHSSFMLLQRYQNDN